MKAKHVDLGPLPSNLSIRTEQMDTRYEQGGQFSFDKWITGFLYLLTGGVFGLGYLYDFWTLNDQITIVNSSE